LLDESEAEVKTKNLFGEFSNREQELNVTARILEIETEKWD
jgi:hypothetical protein